jgi:uncharacterized protein (DUF362 family)
MGHGLILDKEKCQVGIAKGRNVGKVVRKAISLIGGMEKVMLPRSKVLIKPNLGVPFPAKMGVTTDPRIVIALIELAKEMGVKRVAVGESAVVGFDAGAIFDALKVKLLFEKAGANVVNLDHDRLVEIRIPKGEVLKKIKVCRTAYESDVIISAAKMKTHFQTGVTLSLKNMKGTLPDVSKRMMHRIGIPVEKREEYGLDRAIVDLNTVISPDLAIIDAVVALEGFVPGPRLIGNPVCMDTIIAGFDPVAVDAVGCQVMGLNPIQIRHIFFAHERNLGWMLPKEIEVLGQSIESVMRPLKTEISEATLNYKNLAIIEGQGCSGCSVTSRMALSFLSSRDLEALGGITLIVGDVNSTGDLLKERCFFIGNCAIRSNRGKKGKKIGGCPPPGLWVRHGLAS